MKRFKNFIHRQTLAKLGYYKKFYPLGVSFKEYCNYIYAQFENSSQFYWSKLLGIKIKRIHSLSYVHTVEGIFVEQLYKFTSNREDPLILDCGANIGLAIIYFKRLYPKAKIIAFEPDRSIYEACNFNVAAFGFTDVELINAAVWKADGVLNFLPDKGLGGKVVENSNSTLAVNQITAVDLKKYLNQKIDLLKIDIEGAELEVLFHCKENLSLVENLFVEYHSDVKKPQQLQDLLQVLTNAGFRYYMKPAWDYMAHPFTDHKKEAPLNFDLQLNIFAYRV